MGGSKDLVVGMLLLGPNVKKSQRCWHCCAAIWGTHQLNGSTLATDIIFEYDSSESSWAPASKFGGSPKLQPKAEKRLSQFLRGEKKTVLKLNSWLIDFFLV